jgi:hypothetical protein
VARMCKEVGVAYFNELYYLVGTAHEGSEKYHGNRSQNSHYEDPQSYLG